MDVLEKLLAKVLKNVFCTDEHNHIILVIKGLILTAPYLDEHLSGQYHIINNLLSILKFRMRICTQ